MNLNRVCLNCMKTNEYGTDICPHCGQSSSMLRNAANELPVRSVLKNRYLVGRRIGGGGFGIIYMGYDSFTNTTVAIKEFFPGKLAERNVFTSRSGDLHLKNPSSKKTRDHFQKAKEGFIKEGCNLQNCSDIRGIIHVSDLFEENRTVYLVMDYIDGHVLAKEVEMYNGKCPEKRVLAIMRPVIKTLYQLHNHHLVHRDITPQNIMIEESTGRPVLIDFGSARYAGLSNDERHTVLITQGYSPPEQYSIEGKQGPWTDVYALCATMLALLTGRDAAVPDAGPTQERIQKELIRSGTVISERTKAVLCRGLEYHYSRRLQNMEQLYQALYGEPLILQQDGWGSDWNVSKDSFWTTGRIIAISVAGGVVFLLLLLLLCLCML